MDALQEKIKAEKEKTRDDKEFLLKYSNILGISNAIKEIRLEGFAIGVKVGRIQGNIQLIMNIHDKLGLSAEQIADMTRFPAEYIQSLIDEYGRKKQD